MKKRRFWIWGIAGLLVIASIGLFTSLRRQDEGWDWIEKLGGRQVPIKGRVEAGGVGTGPYTMEARAYAFDKGRPKSFWVDYNAYISTEVARAKAEGRMPDRWLISDGSGGKVLLARVRYPNWFYRQLINLRLRLGMGGTSVNTKEVWPPSAYLKEVG